MVDLDLVPVDVGERLGVLYRGVEEDPVGVAHHVGLVTDRYVLSPVRACVLEREPNDSMGAGDADRLERDAGIIKELEAADVVELPLQRRGLVRAALELDALIEVLGVLADDHQVDAVGAGWEGRAAGA